MPSFRCTRKLLKELGAKPIEGPEPHVDDWHANLLRFGPKKIVLFCSSSTLYACVTPPVTRKDIRNIESIFVPALESAMGQEGFSEESISFALSRYAEMSIAKTNDRSVTGSMTDYLYHIESIIWDAGGIENCDFGMVFALLNDIPQIKRDLHCASDAFKKTLIRGVV